MTDPHSPGPFRVEVTKGKTYIVDRDGQRIAHVLRIGRFKSLPTEANAALLVRAERIERNFREIEGHLQFIAQSSDTSWMGMAEVEHYQALLDVMRRRAREALGVLLSPLPPTLVVEIEEDKQ